MDQDATWYGDRPRPRRHCVRWDPETPLKGAEQSPTFRSMSVVAKQSPISATAELLLNMGHINCNSNQAYMSDKEYERN